MSFKDIIQALRVKYGLSETSQVISLYKDSGKTQPAQQRNSQGEFDDVPVEQIVTDFDEITRFDTKVKHSVRFGNQQVFNATRDSINALLAERGLMLVPRTEFGNMTQLRNYQDGSVRCRIDTIEQPHSEGSTLEAILEPLTG
jgi:hypothetical protein